MATKVTVETDRPPLRNSAKEQDWKRRVAIAVGTLMGDANVTVEFKKKGK